jgi:excisionase family DNA binding protein
VSKHSPEINDRLTVTVPEAARLLGVSRMSAYTAVRAGEIPSIRIGRRVLVPRLALERLLNMAEGTYRPNGSNSEAAIP